tara:strand:- start:782 stop:1756 length:975 start_codon:yes stop_codon:yes gene_type:complete
MKEVFANVRPACDFQGVLSDEAAVAVVNGRMEAYNKFLTVSQPCVLPEFAVAAADLDFALRKVENPTVKVTDSNVILTGGGTTRVRLLPARKQLVKPDIQTTPIKNLADLLGAIDDVYPFTEGDPARPWSQGARFDDMTVTATNSIILCQAELASASGFDGVTISRPALTYIRLRRADLKAWGVSKNGILLEFEDGGWALASRMTMEMPAAAVTLVKKVNDWEGLRVVEQDYRHAVLSAAEWADGTLDTTSIYSDRIQAGRLSSQHDAPAVTELADPDVPAVFAAKALVAVMSVADQIAFDRFPSPVPFTTKRGSRGLIAGRTN